MRITLPTNVPARVAVGNVPGVKNGSPKGRVLASSQKAGITRGGQGNQINLADLTQGLPKALMFLRLEPGGLMNDDPVRQPF